MGFPGREVFLRAGGQAERSWRLKIRRVNVRRSRESTAHEGAHAAASGPSVQCAVTAWRGTQEHAQLPVPRRAIRVTPE